MGAEAYTPGNDRHFDGLAEKFANSMYGASRGQLRLSLVQRHIRAHIPLPVGTALLDIGGGLGQMSEWARHEGLCPTLVEPSAEMLARAREVLGASVPCVQADLQTFARESAAPWPRVVCHAMLEWMAHPEEALPLLYGLTAPGGWLSLMVFNHDALRFSNIVKGNLERVVDGRSLAGRGDRKRLTPISPMTHAQVLGWAEAAGFECRAVSGIRVFHDYLRERTPSEVQLSQLAELEARFGDQEPYWRLGRYLHYCLYRPESS
ncbi:methyltransferase domain-containing protein [Larsenimonas rhizosphaerae]|uniref:methyltransferase domain-containing protein n=1 Tax=Larsenimonas rhizosphaerae TaxID=2944682 RepID=UPI0020335713|nr:methyltransferase domain-containing protein [Larsenimonas rhizosphaerae]MCM2131972.1 methyltransferase domain-containing protein [Larsenimonas rhizosphaerae]